MHHTHSFCKSSITTSHCCATSIIVYYLIINMLRTALRSTSRCSLRQARCFSSSSPFSTTAGTTEATDETTKPKKDEPVVEKINLNDIAEVIAKEFGKTSKKGDKLTKKESREILDCAFGAIEHVRWLDCSNDLVPLFHNFVLG